MCQTTDKPGSVLGDHLSSYTVAGIIKRIKWHDCGGRPICNLTSLQQTGFTSLPRHHGRLWALTPLVSPFPLGKPWGSFVSVALSLGSLPVVVNNCLVLCCPDFPPQ